MAVPGVVFSCRCECPNRMPAAMRNWERCMALRSYAMEAIFDANPSACVPVQVSRRVVPHRTEL